MSGLDDSYAEEPTQTAVELAHFSQFLGVDSPLNRREPVFEYIPPGKDYAVAIKQYPVTVHHAPFVQQDGAALVDPGTARANFAPSKERPHGTTGDNWREHHQTKTVIVSHVEYWDTDQDGVIWPTDTYRGCRAFGWSILLSMAAAIIIHLGLSYATCPTIIPDPLFRLWTERMYKAKHGSDSMTYDNEGRFRPQAFEEIFTKYDRDNKGGLSLSDIFRLWRGQALLADFFGVTAVFLEWVATYLLIWPEDGIMKKEDIRQIYDGSIFYRKAEEHRRKTRRVGARKEL